MIAHLQGREKAIQELGFEGEAAEWIALVALHSGVFLRSQYGRFVGDNGRAVRKRAERLAADLLRRGLATDSDVPGLGQICRLKSRAVYRALGAEHIRHRRDAASGTVLRRLLSLDFVLGELEVPWLPTEPEKVAAFESLGIERRRFPKRVYGSKKGGRTVRPFGWKMPVAFGGSRARFAFVDTGGETHDELLSWGAEHTPLWSALAERDMRVELVAVSLSSDRLTEAKNILGKWKESGLSGPGVGMSGAQIDELRVVERALASLDEAAMSRWGGLNGTIQRVAELQRRRDAAGQDRQDRFRPDEVQTRAAGLGWAGVAAC